MMDIYDMFDLRLDRDEGVDKDGFAVKVERMLGCNGQLHADVIHRIFTKDGVVDYAEDLGVEERGVCDGSCNATLGKYPGSGFARL